MSLKADLHTHTTYSDGVLSPFELLDLAKAKGISIISITDHDTVEGIEGAIDYGKNLGIEVIPGVEISSDIDGSEVHFLGYFIDYTNKELNKYLKFFRDERFERAKRIIKKLNKLGISITIDDVLSISKNSPVCRPHIAKALLEKGYVKLFNQAFQKYIGDNAPAFEKKIYVAPQSALKIINDAGGLTFIAHPGFMQEDKLKKIIQLGVDGIEVVHSSHKPFQQKFYKGIVDEYCLLESGGSDFHGGMRNDDDNFGKFVVSSRVVKSIKKMASTKFIDN